MIRVPSRDAESAAPLLDAGLCCRVIASNQRKIPRAAAPPEAFKRERGEGSACHATITLPSYKGSRAADEEQVPSLPYSCKDMRIGHGGTQENKVAQDSYAKDKGRAKALVATRYTRKRCARPEARRIQADQCEEDRGVAQAVG